MRDPAEHARALLGREVAVVTEDASPIGRRHFAVYDPPIVDAGLYDLDTSEVEWLDAPEEPNAAPAEPEERSAR